MPPAANVRYPPVMACSTCSAASSFRSISIAMVKGAAARLRRTGALSTAVDWVARAETCERCPLRVIRGNVSYCGTPFLQLVNRDPTLDGCGCPTRDKAKAPGEHCPISPRYEAAAKADGRCDCKWCAVEKPTEPSGSAAGLPTGSPVRFASLSVG